MGQGKQPPCPGLPNAGGAAATTGTTFRLLGVIGDSTLKIKWVGWIDGSIHFHTSIDPSINVQWIGLVLSTYFRVPWHVDPRLGHRNEDSGASSRTLVQGRKQGGSEPCICYRRGDMFLMFPSPLASLVFYALIHYYGGMNGFPRFSMSTPKIHVCQHHQFGSRREGAFCLSSP